MDRKNRKNKLFGLIIGAGILTCQLSFSPLALADTSIRAVVCNQDSAPNIAISSPKSDTTLPSGEVIIRGEVNHSTQLEVFIDDQYDQTLSLSPNQDNFSVSVFPGDGAHTLEVRAHGLCDDETSSDSVVVTLVARQIPDSGGEPGEEVPITQPQTILPEKNSDIIVSSPDPLIRRAADISTKSSVGEIAPIETTGSVSQFDAVGQFFKTLSPAGAPQLFWQSVFIVGSGALLFSGALMRLDLIRLVFSQQRFLGVAAALVMAMALVFASSS